MAVKAFTGKKCTLEVTVGAGAAVPCTAWLTSREASASIPVDTTATWGENVTSDGLPTYTVSYDIVADAAGTAAMALFEAAMADRSVLLIEETLDGATRTYTGYTVSDISDTVPADSLATGSVSLVGTAMWATVWNTTP